MSYNDPEVSGPYPTTHSLPQSVMGSTSMHVFFPSWCASKYIQIQYIHLSNMLDWGMRVSCSWIGKHVLVLKVVRWEIFQLGGVSCSMGSPLLTCIGSGGLASLCCI